MPSDYEELRFNFEEIEPGSAAKLNKFLKEAQFKYEQRMGSISLGEFANVGFLKGALRLQVFSSFCRNVRQHFNDPRLIALMEFPVLFLGATPQDTPALYSLMNMQPLSWTPDT